MKLTAPGITDLEWMVTSCSWTERGTSTSVSFFETEEDARSYALGMLDVPRTSVYVSRVVAHGENAVRGHRKPAPLGTGAKKRAPSDGPQPFEVTDDHPTAPMRGIRR